jgi:hypothetical protein
MALLFYSIFCLSRLCVWTVWMHQLDDPDLLNVWCQKNLRRRTITNSHLIVKIVISFRPLDNPNHPLMQSSSPPRREVELDACTCTKLCGWFRILAWLILGLTDDVWGHYCIFISCRRARVLIGAFPSAAVRCLRGSIRLKTQSTTHVHIAMIA